jgi:hypothetical protein
MLGFFKERKWLSDAETSMAFLLAFQGEQFVKLIYKQYPNAKALVIERAKAGESGNRTASEILRIVLTDQITRFCPDEERKQLLAYLTTDDEAELKNPPSLLARLCRSYTTMMFRESDLKKLDEQWVKDCLHDVYFAVKGMSPEERSNDRMMKAFENALTKS